MAWQRTQRSPPGRSRRAATAASSRRARASACSTSAAAAVELYTLGCTRGSGRACATLAALAERRDRRDPQVFTRYERACSQGYLPACTELAQRYDTGELIPRDPDHALAIYRWAC